MKTGVELIADERERQVSQEGWTAEHDRAHVGGELVKAADCYIYAAVAAGTQRIESLMEVPCANGPWGPSWPWHKSWWKPSKDPVRNLVKAAALAAAEIDRRLACGETPTPITDAAIDMGQLEMVCRKLERDLFLKSAEIDRLQRIEEPRAEGGAGEA